MTKLTVTTNLLRITQIVETILMDRATLLAFKTHCGEEEKQELRDLPRLNPDERVLYDDLRDNRIRKNLRLEQERIGFGWVESVLSVLVRNAHRASFS
jgi:hypothetical protein